MNLQIRLYETSNVIEVWHDDGFVPVNTTPFVPGQIGLRGATNTDFNNRKLFTIIAHWPATDVGTLASNGVQTRDIAYNLNDTRFTWTPPCYAPSALTVTGFTFTTANIGWTGPFSAPANYQYEVRSVGLPGSGPAGLGASGTLAGTSTSAVATGLTEGFTYRLYVRSACGGSDFSAWIPGPLFTLPCTSTAVPYFLFMDPITEGFTVPALPSCTINQNAGLGNNWVTTATGAADDDSGFFDEHLIYRASTSQNANTWFITKGINLVAGQTYRLEYLYGGSSIDPLLTNSMEVRYGTTPTAAGLSASIQLQDHPIIKSSGLSNIINFTAPTSNVYYFGYRAYSLLNNGNLYLDEIQLTESICLIPTGLTAPGVLISFNNATITWTAPSPVPSNGYAYYISTVNTPPTNSTILSGTVPAGTTITTIPSLTPSTTYYVWVRSSCGGDDFGEWSVGTSFTTLPAPPTYCIPVGANVDGTGLTNVTFGSINNTTGNESATNFYGDYSGLTSNIARDTTIPISLTFSTSGFDYFVKIWIDWNNDGDFIDAGEEVYSGVTIMLSPSVLNASFFVPIGATLGPKRMRIGGIDDPVFPGGPLTPCRSGSWQTFEDYTVNVVVAPPLLTLSATTMPAQCGLTNSPLVTVTAGLADYDVFTWTPSSGVTGTPASGYVFNTTVTTTFTLTASQTSGSFSTNSASFTYVANSTPTPITITTPSGTVSCVNGPPIPLNAGGGIVANVTIFEDNFNSGINGPGQFTSSNNSTGGNPAAAAWTVRPSPYTVPGGSWTATLASNDNTSFVLSNSDAQGNGSTTRTRLTSPDIILTGYTAATVSFRHFFVRWPNDVFVLVEVTTDAGANWTTIANYNTNQGTQSNFTQAFLNLNPFLNANPLTVVTAQIRFSYQSAWGFGWAIDNFRVVGSATSDIVWSPTAGLFNDAAGLTPYTGTPRSIVYAAPSTDTVYQAAATGPSPTFCQSLQTVAITVTPQVGGVLSADQSSCNTSDFIAITLSGELGTVVRWEYANNLAFTVGVTPIANTSNTLTPAQFGTFSGVRYFRALVGVGTCNPVPSSVAVVDVLTTIQSGTNTWSNGLPDITKRVIITGNYTVGSSISACSIEVALGATMEVINNGTTVTVENGITVSPFALPNSVIFQNNTSLLQNSTSNTINSGSVRYIRETTPIIQYDYTYWSSPVENQIIKNFSPSTNNLRFYTFNSGPAYAWQTVPSVITHIMAAAVGYIIRAPNTISTTAAAPWSGEFYGSPRNGSYTATVFDNGLVAGVDQNRNLLGNPYPSAIDADLLWAENSTTLTGNFYFWTHNTASTGQLYNADDYAQYNASGGVGTSALALGGNNVAPNGNIAAGQGFFVEGLSSGTVTFNNTIRIAGDNDLFYRSQGIERHRVWLNVLNNQGAFKQTLVGYIEGASNERDTRFDGDYVETGNVVALYSLVNEETLTIQGRALPFIDSDEVPLGFKTTIDGTFQIQLADFDGLFSQGQGIYLEDKQLNIVHDLRAGDYSFATNAGTFNNRFELQFVDTTLNVPTFKEDTVIVYKNNQTIYVNSGVTEMSRVKVMDLRGRLIAEKDQINAAEVQFSNLNASQQVLLVQITTTDGTIVTKRVIY
jgi:hypothetical protein